MYIFAFCYEYNVFGFPFQSANRIDESYYKGR